MADFKSMILNFEKVSANKQRVYSIYGTMKSVIKGCNCYTGLSLTKVVINLEGVQHERTSNPLEEMKPNK